MRRSRSWLGLLPVAAVVVAALLLAGSALSNTGSEAITANPSSNLPDTGNVDVLVSGSGFVASADVFIQQCSTDPGQGLCAPLEEFVPTAEDGTFETTVQVSYDMRGFAPDSGPFCNTSPTETCYITAEYHNGGTGVGATTPITFAGHVQTVDHFDISPASGAQTAGTAFSVTVTAKDASNATVTGYTGTISFSSNDPQAVLPASYPFVAGDEGTHTFTDGVTLKTAGTGKT